MASRTKEKLPKIRNLPLYAYGCLAKLVGAALFAVIACVTALVLLLFSLLRRQWPVFGRLSRKFVSLACRLYVFLLRCIFFMKLKLTDEDKKKLKALKSTVIVANHPSILDIPLLLSLVPAASLIIPPKSRFPLSLFKDAYTVADSWDSLLMGCRNTVSRGGNIIIFPERHLTPRSGTNPYRRTAARLARECAADLQPLYIGGSDKRGLGSPAAPLAYCRSGIYLYELKLLPPILLAGYVQMKDREASVAVTKKIHDEISAEAYLSDYRIV
ncbi:MAG: hypothetical protein K6G18_02020 [Treponema sp.]|nr:hypothetical protein [Treponema sp.]